MLAARAAAQGVCSDKVQIPPDPPALATTYNGVALPDICFMKPGPYSVYAIGDWGGIVYGPRLPPVPADKRSKFFPSFHRKFVKGVDDRAQLKVAAEIRSRSVVFPPDFFLNAGDNFYWGGVNGSCGQAPYQQSPSGQWQSIFETVYWGQGIANKPWFGVLGNHDYGGYKFTAAWASNIGYSWGGGEENSRRWVQPALFYSQKVNYPGFSILMLFVDSNIHEAWTPEMNPSHNICGKEHNGLDAQCGASGGPPDVPTCHGWFLNMWGEQVDWMEKVLSTTQSTWQVVVTHFPPNYGSSIWECMASRFGLDLFVSGHIHKQRIFGPTEEKNPLQNTCTVITGGGGGITSEDPPRMDGYDDSYGFVHLSFTATNIVVQAISHNGVMRKVVGCGLRNPESGPSCARKTSMVEQNSTFV